MENSETTQPSSIANLKFTAVRLDVRRLTSSGRHRPRSQVFVISDRTSGLEMKRMVAEKNGIDGDLVYQMDLMATVSSGDAKSELLVPDDRCPLDAYRVSSDRVVSFSLKWRKEPKPSAANYYTPPSSAQSNNANASTVQSPCPDLTLKKSDRKPNDRISYTNGSNFPGYNKKENGPTVDLGAVDSQIRRLHSTSSSGSPWHSDRNKTECIIHYEPQELSPRTDVHSSNFYSVAVQELPSSTSRTSSDDGSVINSRTSQTGVTELPGVNSISRSSDEAQSYSNSSNQLPTLTRGERHSLGDIASTSSSLHTFYQSVPAGKATPDEAGQSGDQREAKFSSLPNMDQMNEAQRWRGGDQAGIRQATSSSSLPCVSNTENGLVGAGRRYLPRLCIPEKIVEEKRNLLSKKLERKLKSAGRKKKRKQGTASDQVNIAGASHSSKGRIDRKERKKEVSGDESDDCMSVTSWEVADILASADPMAPQDSDYEDTPPSNDDENVTSAFKSCRVMSSASETDTLDESSTESDHRNEFVKDFSPIRSAQGIQNRLDFRSQLGSNRHVSSVKPVATSSETLSADLKTITHNPIRSSEASLVKVPSLVKAPSLFKLLRNGTFRLRTSVLSRRSSPSRRADRLPFEIFNDVIYLNDVRHMQKDTGSVKERFTVPVIGDSIEDTPNWECLEGSIETGDIVVEVNGVLVLNRSSSEVATTCLHSSDNLQLLLARQRTYKSNA